MISDDGRRESPPVDWPVHQAERPGRSGRMRNCGQLETTGQLVFYNNTLCLGVVSLARFCFVVFEISTDGCGDHSRW